MLQTFRRLYLNKISIDNWFNISQHILCFTCGTIYYYCAQTFDKKNSEKTNKQNKQSNNTKQKKKERKKKEKDKKKRQTNKNKRKKKQ